MGEDAEQYGEKLLRKFGWFPGRGIGRNPKGESQVLFLSKPRIGRLGVGAELPGEELSAKQATMNVGDQVRISKGKHADVCGVIAEMDGEYAVIEVGARRIRAPLLYLDTAAESLQPATPATQPTHRKPLRWVIPGIRIRIISKSKCEGRLYNTKGAVQDVTGACSFTVVTDARELIDDLGERDVETLVPQVGEEVMVLTQEHRGEVGKLVERDKKRNRVLVQLPSHSELIRTTQDDVCELA